ncbi:MAG TPA: NAD-dependent epimerase/dehydratase family protein, partial [Bacteroidales bacterium]|nr:NAD-dependent epimerase/dehydratase family protein [Bacteroidales bacterium]
VFKRSESDLNRIKKTFAIYNDSFDDYSHQIEFINGNLLEIHSIREALKEVSQVYHCAALVSFQPRDKHVIVQTNYNCTANLVNACLEIENIQFCYVSSVSTLGLTKQGETLNETNCWKESRGNSLYAISKYVAEREVWRATKEGLKAFIVNPSIILGPGDWKTDSSQLIAKVAKGISFYTEGVMGFVDVRDVAEIMVLLMDVEMKNERFIISSENLSYKELFKIITDTFEKKKPSFKLSPCILQLAWRICYPMTLFGFQPLITKEIANSASKQIFYDNTKIKNFLNYQFIPIKKSVADIGKIFIENQQKS